MLVLSRRVGEEIVIGENVRVKVVAAHGKKVRLAVCAPKTVRIDRLEINERRSFGKSGACPDLGFAPSFLAAHKPSGLA
jgi:carbon storage regulator